MDSKCVQCGNENDLMVAFTKHKVCGKCVKKNYKKVVKGKQMENKYGYFYRAGDAVVMKKNGKAIWFVDGWRTIADGQMQYVLDLYRVVKDKTVRKTVTYSAVKLYN